MRTIDFLPGDRFAAHLERRRVPFRVLVLLVLTVFLETGVLALSLEVKHEEAKAELLEAPNPQEVAAGEELERIYAEMSEYATRLDPLTQHLRLPTAGRFLAGLASVLGRYVQLEEFDWDLQVGRKGQKVDFAELHVEVTALVRGDETLLALPHELQEHGGFVWAETVKSELVPDQPDTMRTVVQLVGEVLMPGMKEPKVRKEYRP